MPSALTKAEQSTPTLQTASDPTPTSQHGQRLEDNSRRSLLPHARGSQGEPEPPTGGNECDAPLPDALAYNLHHAVETSELRDSRPVTHPYRERVTLCESARAASLRKPSEGPLFEVTSSNGVLNGDISPIAKLPNEVLIHAIAHLSPNDLAAVSLVSRHFNNVVTTPHAWQVAFARHFSGAQLLENAGSRSALEDSGAVVRSEKRSFTRLTALATWRSEYILRTRLLRSLARGKPVQQPSAPSRPGRVQAATPTITYDTKTYAIINHLHATFDSGLNNRMPRLIHGADDVGYVTSSDPMAGKVDPWGQTDPHLYFQFAERFPGTAQWGLGSGDVVGCPNVMDVSQPYGFINGEGCPGGSCYYRSLDEMRGRLVAEPSDFTLPEAGIPNLGADSSAICSVWIAKSYNIPSLSKGLIGMMMGSAAGVISACSLGSYGLPTSRAQRGELIARWVLSPGVPIIAITVDDNYSAKRHAQDRIWAVALNALGELFHLTKFPTRSQSSEGTSDHYTERLAWLTGRSVHWTLVEPSRRIARPDPYSDADVDGSYSPRTSWDGMCLDEDQLVAETREIQEFMRKPPKHFRKVCRGWDMRRRLEVDFAGDDGNHAGEAMIVFECGLDEGAPADATRFTRQKTRQKDKSNATSTTLPQPTSLFGGSGSDTPPTSHTYTRARSSSAVSATGSQGQTSMQEEWRCSKLTFGSFTNTRITTTTLDRSTFATLTLSEDPALGFSTASTASSPYESPISVAGQPASPSDIPGQRARLVAAGTMTGVVILWDIRADVSRSSEYTNNISPVCIIHTDSPEISCLAMTGLCMVVGGNDGLVQAWDPLLSSVAPIRTLNSRHASKARRRLVQAQASLQGVGINMFAAGAICLDSDPTVLRGAVSLGNQLRYWSFSSSSADAYKGNKRRLRRSERSVPERSSNKAVVERFSGTGRINISSYIANEQFELEREEQEHQKQAERLAERFGTALLSEEEVIAYATVLSQESMEAEAQRRHDSKSSSAMSSETVTHESDVVDSFSSPALKEDDELDADIAEAIRQSLGPTSSTYSPSPTPPSAFEIPIKYAKRKKSISPPKLKHTPTRKEKTPVGSSDQMELSDLELAIQLSLVEEQSRKDGGDAFPPLGPTLGGDGKGKGRMW